MSLTTPFSLAEVQAIHQQHPTPFHLYDEARMRQRARYLQVTMASAGVPGFRNYFAVKALPNPVVVGLLAEEGMGVDCSSMAELAIAEMCGLTGDDIMFTSNNTTDEEFAYAASLGAIINFDDVSLVRKYLARHGAPRVACCRFNPGDLEFGGVNEELIGSPREAKYGMPLEDILESYRLLKGAGVTQFGLHTMLLSNELDFHKHQLIAEKLFAAARRVASEVGISFQFINLGGGIGVPYRPSEQAFELESFAAMLSKIYHEAGLENIGAPAIVMENGRYATAEAGWLVTKVINEKRTHKQYVGVDASMSDLMRPGMYRAYHHISVLGKENQPAELTVDVVGSLCENNDKFAIDRALPAVAEGDLLVIHTTGAHGQSMGFQYNGRLRHAELLRRSDGSVDMIRRAETLDDYFATLTTKGVYHVPTN